MKVQYDLEGSQLNQSRWCCSKFVLGAILLVVLMLGSALATICFQRYWEDRHVQLATTTTNGVSKEVQEIQEIAYIKINLDERYKEEQPVDVSTEFPTITTTTTTTTTTNTVEATTEVQEILEIAHFEINLDDQGLKVNVNQDNGSMLSITEASSDLLKEFAGLFMAEAFAAIRNLEEVRNAKHVDIPELPPVEASTEEIWSWSTNEGHDGFRIRFDNGEWKFLAVSREESQEERSSDFEAKKESEEVKEEQISTEEPEEIWSWSSKGFNGFRINFTDGQWSFETVSQESEEDSNSDKSE